MKISLGMHLQAGAWGGGNQFGHALKAALEAAGHQVIHDLNSPDIDLILLADPRPELRITAYNQHDILRYLRTVNPAALVVHRINECDERKGERDKINPLLRQATRIADHTVFVSRWLHDLHLSQGMQPQAASVILNGSDSRIFHPQGYQPWDGREPLKLVTHHWGGHWLKGFDIYQQLDEMLATPAYKERIEFTYIGNLPEGFSFKNARYLPPMNGEALANALRAQHVYLTAAQFEPGSNHQNEGALCGLPLLYREGDSLEEYCAGFGIGFNGENFRAKLDEMLATYPHWLSQMPKFPHTAERATAAYVQLFEVMLAERDTHQVRRCWPTQIPTIKTQVEAINWLQGLREPLSNYLEILRTPDGSYHMVAEGLTDHGAAIRLPWRAWALKLAVMLNTWDDLSSAQQQAEISALQAFQVRGNPQLLPNGYNAFIDPAIIRAVNGAKRRHERLLERIKPSRFLGRVISAETKQAIATLHEVGAEALRSYRGFPQDSKALTHYLNAFDWSQPWEAGAHAATLAVYYQTQAPRFLPLDRVNALNYQLNDFINGLLDPQTGAYFQGNVPPYEQLINGAMKIITALDWLGTPVHAPQELIDTALSALPQAEGCHLVDAVYVLHQCARYSDHRRGDIQAYALKIAALLVEHYNPLDGGFSYYIGRSQPFLHHIRVSGQRPISDLHGTLLLTWAAAMLLDLLGADNPFKLIKP